MTSEEKYYRRTYSLLNKLFDTYNNGFNRKKTLQFWKEEFIKFNDKPLISAEQQHSLMLTIIIALLGINKESIEKAEKITDYNESIVYKDFRNNKLMDDSKQKLVNFENSKNQNTIFDNWLSIIKSPPSDLNNKDIFRRVRNGLLHSNFSVDLEAFQTTYTNIKTKSYYESIILNENFFQFIMSYFGNVAGVGLTDKDTVYDIKKIEIKSYDTFKKYLEELTIIEIENNITNYNGNNSLGIQMQEKLSKDKNILSSTRFTKILNNAKENGINIKDIKEFKLTESIIESIITNIIKKYSDFYKLDDKKKINIINGELRYLLNNKGEISNWLIHFYYLINSISDKNFDINHEMFLFDEFANNSCKSTLVILKAYLILYRLQNNEFDKVEYDKITFDFNDDRFFIWSENKDGSSPNDNYYEISYQKIVNKNPDMLTEDIKKIIICEVIRDGLAHGNIKTFIDKNETIIEIKDINPKNNNHTRCIQLTLEKFKEFLDSEAFLPKNCYKKINITTDNNVVKK